MRSDSTLGIQIAGIAATVDNNRITRNKIMNHTGLVFQSRKGIRLFAKAHMVITSYVVQIVQPLRIL